MRRWSLAMVALAVLGSAPAEANDGFGGLWSGGLRFSKSDSVRMVAEDLFLSPSLVRVDYLFRNESDREVSGEVIFPLPPISLFSLLESDFAVAGEQLRGDNPAGFTATVDGVKIAVQTERIAVLTPNSEEPAQPADLLDHPGREVTAELIRHGIPISLDARAVMARLANLPGPAKEQLRVQGLADFIDPEHPLPSWSIVVRYHFPQRFAPGREVRIGHRYNPAPPGGVFIWPSRETDLGGYERQLAADYCIDATTRRGLTRLLNPPGSEPAGVGTAVFLDYVLTTARTWKGPISTFRLTIDKGAPDAILSLCLDGLRKTGPTTFELEKKDFLPARDLRLLIVSRPAQ